MTHKPIPRATIDSAPFHEGCADGELRIQICGACERPQFPPSRQCRACRSDALSWKKTRGLGEIHAVTVVHRAPTKAFRADAPYALALVDLDEGVRMMLNVIGAGATESKIGDRVRVVFEQRAEGVAIAQCELA